MQTELKQARQAAGPGALSNEPRIGRDPRPYYTIPYQALLDAALAWLALGVELVPLQPKSKSIIRGFGPHLRRISQPGEAIAWFGERRCNLGLVCGGRAGLAVLDFDQVGDYLDWRAGADDLAQTYTVKTWRGFHVYLWAGDIPSGRVGQVEVKGRGAVIMAAPSVHPSGAVYYAIEPGAAILQASPKNLPLLSELGKEKPGGQAARPAPVLAGGTDLVGRIKAAWPILDMAQAMTRLHSRDGRWFHGLCPLHSEKEPSFWVDAERGVFGCFSCQARGDVINLYALRYGLTVQDAIREMARKLPMEGGR